jgi:signal transduction histidine kinase/ligand-binding sensor domain-containing protein
MRLRKLLLSVFLFVGLALNGQPQMYWNRILLPSVSKHINIKSITQDSDGFIWLGGNSGLFRFDGHITKKIEFSEVDQSDKKVKDILVVENSLFLILGNTNLVKLNTQTFEHDIVYSSNLNIEGYIVDIEKAENGKLVFATSHNYIITIDTKNKNKIIDKLRDRNRFVIQKLLLKDSLKIMGTRPRGVCIIDDKNESHLLPPSVKFPYPGYSIENLCAVNDSLIIMGGWDNAIHVYNLKKKKVDHLIFNETSDFQYEGDEITNLLKVDKDEVWVGTKLSGLYSYRISKNQVKPIVDNINIGKWIYNIFVDNYGNRWLSSDNGLFLWSKENQAIQHFNLDEKLNQKRKVYSIANQGDDILFGTDSGIYLVNDLNNSSQYYTTKYNGAELGIYSILWPKNIDPILGTNKSLYSINLSTGKLYTAIPKYDADTNKNSTFSANSLVSSRYTNVIEYTQDSSNFILASTYGHGLFEYNIGNGHGNFAVLGKDNVFGYLITNLIVDKKNALWATCKENGIFYNFKYKEFRVNENGVVVTDDTSTIITLLSLRFEAEKHWSVDGKNGLSNQNITCFVERNDDTFWVGTNGGGIYHFNPKRSPAFIRVVNSIDAPAAILEDSMNRLWIIENGNLNLFDIKSNVLIKYDQYTGISEFGIHAPLYKADNGFIYAGGIGNYYRFRPEDVEVSPQKTKVDFTGLSSLYNNLDTLIVDNCFELTEANSVFTIYFTSHNYNHLNNINYKYYLSGFHETWVSIGNAGSITFNQLSPGDYILKVRAFTSEGLPISEIGTINFVIKPYWYKSLWFKVTIVILILVIAYLFYRYRINQLLEVQHIRDQIARDLHDDIGSTLGAINIYTKAAQNNLELKNPERVNSILEEIGQHSREMSNHMGDIIWSVNPINDELTHLTKRIEQYSTLLLEKANIDFHFEVDNQINEWNLSMEKRKNIYLIIKEALHNAVKYSNCTSISLSFKKQNNRLEIIVMDNGDGFSLDSIDPINGNGLASMEYRCKEMKAVFIIDSAPGAGCIISLLV